jgi:hypothetical protein
MDFLIYLDAPTRGRWALLSLTRRSHRWHAAALPPDTAVARLTRRLISNHLWYSKDPRILVPVDSDKHRCHVIFSCTQTVQTTRPLFQSDSRRSPTKVSSTFSALERYTQSYRGQQLPFTSTFTEPQSAAYPTSADSNTRPNWTIKSAIDIERWSSAEHGNNCFPSYPYGAHYCQQTQRGLECGTEWSGSHTSGAGEERRCVSPSQVCCRRAGRLSGCNTGELQLFIHNRGLCLTRIPGSRSES